MKQNEVHISKIFFEFSSKDGYLFFWGFLLLIFLSTKKMIISDTITRTVVMREKSTIQLFESKSQYRM